MTLRTHRNAHWIFSTLLLLSLAAASPAVAQDELAASEDTGEDTGDRVLSADEEERLREWVDVAAERDTSTQTLLASATIVAGTLFTALGAGSLAYPEIVEQPLLSPFASTVTLTGGLFFIGSGIASLLTMTPAEGLRASLPDHRLTVRDLGRLEGRLALASENALNGRITTGVLGGTTALSGGVSMALMGATGLDPTEYPLDWVLAGGLTLAGAFSLIMSLFETSAETDWREYRGGLGPSPRSDVAFRATGTGFELTF